MNDHPDPSCIPCFSGTPTGVQQRGACRPGRGVPGVCHGPSARAGSVVAGPPKRAAGRASLAGGHAAGGASDAAKSSSRRIDRSRGRARLSLALRRRGRDPRRPFGAEFHRHPPPCPAGRGAWCHTLADPARRARARTERIARPLAGQRVALDPPSRRSCRTGAPALAGGTSSLAQQAPRHLGSQP